MHKEVAILTISIGHLETHITPNSLRHIGLAMAYMYYADDKSGAVGSYFTGCLGRER